MLTSSWWAVVFSVLMWSAPIGLVMLSGCSNLKEVDKTLSWSPQKLYDEAKDELNSGNYQAAIKLFDKLESRYPFGRFAQQALLESAYAYYKDGDAAVALSALDRFIKQYPNHPNLDYAYYLRGLVNFNDTNGIIANLLKEDPADRDPKAGKDAIEAFSVLIQRFPDSRYVADAQARQQYIVNGLARFELKAARYYMVRGAYIAALNRAQEVVKQFPDNAVAEEALYIMVRAYQQLNLPELAQDTERVLRLNFPKTTLLSQKN